MHPSAYADAERFVSRYLKDRADLQIADVGSLDVNGSLRPLFARPGWIYVGLDTAAGPNVDVVLSSDLSWSEIADDSFDIVVSSQTLEHVQRPWKWMPELARICRPGGLVYVCSPNTWGYHEYPVDCWRVWPEGLDALFQEAGLESVELYANGPDTTGIGRKLCRPALELREDPPPLIVLCLTTGRETLRSTLNSLRRQTWRPGDEVLLVQDGPVTPFVFQAWTEASLPGRLLSIADGPHGDWGHTPRNRILPEITRGYVVHLDDDDNLAPSALDAVRRAIYEHPGALFFFRLAYPDGRLLWKTEQISHGNVGTGSLVHPADIPLGRFDRDHSGDFEFVRQTVALNPDRRVIWRKEATYVIRPHERWSNPAFVDLRHHGGATGRPDCQSGWQEFFGRYFRREQILDVGSGIAQAKARLAAGGNNVTTQDVAPALPVDLRCELSDVPSAAFDVVTAFDVLEHVPDDSGFLRELVRIGRKAVVITTPNVWVWHCRNPHHVREYSPPALLDLVASTTGISRIDAFASVRQDGGCPTHLPLQRFLSTEFPVLGIVAWLATG